MKIKNHKKLSAKDTERLTDFYTHAFQIYGENDPRSLQWNEIEDQITRFNVLLDIVSHENTTILDVGCGFGDLYAFLTDKKLDLKYTGIDIIPEFIKTAQKYFPDVSFRKADIFEMTQTFDYVVASGAMSFKVADSQTYYFSMIKKMYELSNRAVAFNMLSRATPTGSNTYASYNPEEVKDFCESFADHVYLIEGYAPPDFTIYLQKNQD